jgi:hypothetical protein
MKTLVILEPIWRNRSVGINEKYLVEKNILIDIIYKTKSGERVYPYTYIISAEKMKLYPTQFMKGNKLFIVPIAELEIYDSKQEIMKI